MGFGFPFKRPNVVILLSLCWVWHAIIWNAHIMSKCTSVNMQETRIVDCSWKIPINMQKKVVYPQKPQTT